MPIPLFAWAAGAAVVAAIGSGLWIYKSAKGKQLVVLGLRKSGKTTLATFLESGQIPKGYTPTQSPRKFATTVKFADLELKIRCTDVSGDQSAWMVWQEEANKADLVCFLATWPSLESDLDWEQVEHAATQVGSWYVHGKTALVVTFTDRAKGVPADSIRSAIRVKKLRRLLGEGPIFTVDQTNSNERLDLGNQILEILK